MREIRSSGKVIGADRIAVMAALNITHDLLHKDARTCRPAARPANRCATCWIVSIWCCPTIRTHQG
jgi:cell division protein ZapA (FtsZ GTPase activity inhibitor)